MKFLMAFVFMRNFLRFAAKNEKGTAIDYFKIDEMKWTIKKSCCYIFRTAAGGKNYGALPMANFFMTITCREKKKRRRTCKRIGSMFRPIYNIEFVSSLRRNTPENKAAKLFQSE